ncbi:hypothetical protein OG21DRAFT_1514328 [Imleria badia]|nr:hypothetical protein OG21DRAFT_1514328 [Imleria badia]
MDPLYARLFARAPVYDVLFACLSPRSLVRLALTCRAAYLAVAEFKTRAFNINRHFSRFFTDPIAFRCLQARTNTLVSGSNALQFLDRTCYPEADLDLYTHRNHSFEVAQFLVEAEGYRYVPRDRQKKDWKVAIDLKFDLTQYRAVVRGNSGHAYPTTNIRDVWTFEKTNIHQECLTVQIVEAQSSALESILGFHSTCVMNFISSDAAYSLYPIATFEERSALGMPPSRRSPKAVEKYVRRGWRFYFMPPPNHPAFFLEQVRWVTDKHTWSLQLDQTGVKERPPLSRTSAPLTCDPALFNGWLFKFHKHEDDEGWETKGYVCDYYPLKTTLFRYNYAITDEALQLAIRDWAHQQGQVCHREVPKEDWVWFDADIPAFFKEANLAK